MARIALGNEDDALDIVQDAMMILANKYSHKTMNEWRPLFFKILHNRIRDHKRRQRVRDRLTVYLNPFFHNDKDEITNPIDHIADRPSNNPALELESNRSMEALNNALHQLPPRQQQVFMLRCWEGLSTAEAATIMSCSQGSVKTHYFRALHFLQKALGDHYHD